MSGHADTSTEGDDQKPTYQLTTWDNVAIWGVCIALFLGVAGCYVYFDHQAKQEQERYEECFVERWTPQHTDEDERNLRRYCESVADR